jgi:hypothetical protein
MVPKSWSRSSTRSNPAGDGSLPTLAIQLLGSGIGCSFVDDLANGERWERFPACSPLSVELALVCATVFIHAAVMLLGLRFARRWLSSHESDAGFFGQSFSCSSLW